MRNQNIYEKPHKLPRVFDYETAPRPSTELRNRLFGKVTTEQRPPLTTIRLPTYPDEGGPCVWVDRFCHERARAAIDYLFAAWTLAGLIEHVVTLDRIYEPRFGPNGRPMTHAHGNAFDINGQWNALGKRPAAFGEPGHIPAEMLDLARQNGFWCGTDWQSPAHKHFELTRV